MNDKIKYLILPLILSAVSAVWATEPILISEQDAAIPVQTTAQDLSETEFEPKIASEQNSMQSEELTAIQDQPAAETENSQIEIKKSGIRSKIASWFSTKNASKNTATDETVETEETFETTVAPDNSETVEPNAYSADTSKSEQPDDAAGENTLTNDSLLQQEPEITLENSNKKKKKKKNKDDYSEYLIPQDSYLPVGNVDDKQIYIQGSVSKTEQLSLSDCLELALQNNPKIKAAYANSAAVKENKVQTISNYTPSISTNSGISRIKADPVGTGASTSSYSKYLLGTISLSQLVYDFGVTQNQYTINKIEWEISKQNIESVVNSVVCDVKDAYYNLLYAISAKQVRAETVEQYEQTYNQAKAFYEIGTKPKVDVTIASANLADARANYIQASNAVDIAVSKLNNAMGTPFIAPYVVDTSMPLVETDITMHGAIEIANQARPDLKSAIEQVKMAEQSIKLIKKVWAPQISVSADLSMGGKSNFTDKSWYTVGGYFSFPVINPVTVTSQVKQAKSQLEQQRYNARASVNDIYYEIQTAFVQLNDARERIVASKIAVQEARESYELSQGRYKAGVCDAIELKESQITYENAKLAYISNIYTFNSAKASLEKAIGQSLKPADVQENVEI